MYEGHLGFLQQTEILASVTQRYGLRIAYADMGLGKAMLHVARTCVTEMS